MDDVVGSFDRADLAGQGVSPYAYNVSNQLTAKPNVTYTYDNNGNTLSKTDASGTTAYTWDYENRLTSVTLPGSGGTVTFKYDPLGRRIQKVSPAGTSIYAYDGDNLIEETDGSGTVVARYAQGLNIDEPLAMLRGGATSYYHADGLGSVTSLANGSGTLTQTYTYNSFGKLTASSGSLTNPFQYTAREFDTETGLYFNRARYYDQTIGRFVIEDPISFDGGVNFYPYVLNRPTVLVDPFGLESGNINRLVPGPGNVPMFPWQPWGPPGSTADDGLGAFQDFWENYRNMRRANTVGADRYFHCMANCQASRRGPASCLVARRLSNLREWFDRHIKRDPVQASRDDQVANIMGRNGDPKLPCNQVCAPLRPNGLPPQY